MKFKGTINLGTIPGMEDVPAAQVLKNASIGYEVEATPAELLEMSRYMPEMTSNFMEAVQEAIIGFAACDQLSEEIADIMAEEKTESKDNVTPEVQFKTVVVKPGQDIMSAILEAVTGMTGDRK